jgi:Arc/MetJ family transcription regulator
MRRHTTLNLDDELVADAARTLGTRGTTETVHAALREIVARERRRMLVEMEMTDLTPAALEQLRAPRSFTTTRRARKS